ncbi:hypothetical protein IEG05_00345 [Pseudomonas kunmingensis]|uniref:hypothetical protein n=1 Tax=Stutzerimonas kunmingensis TaxID=1211807 RepID=UPI001746CC64|nr:hypothetical protein [Stutzerimonas kunmingensis]MBD3873686.1 hypothetical protein [Stutzerimonas kunmingensis]
MCFLPCCPTPFWLLWPAFREHWLAQVGEDILYPVPGDAKAEDHDASGETGEEGDALIATAPSRKSAKLKKAREAEAEQASRR